MSDGPKTKITRGKERVDMIGPYRLLSVLGSGGFGTVYAADAPDGSRVAVKVLAQHMMSDEQVRRFEREGDIRIEHPNVVRVLDAGRVDDGPPYIVFELLEGEPLNERLRIAPLPVAEVLDLATQICAGLTAAHARGIVHRDLKPGNVYLCRDGRVKVLDFGIARPIKATDQRLTMVGSVVGTPGFLAPEQARGEDDVDPRADLWALGVILYEALSGVSPFLRDSAVATILAVVLEEPAPLAGKAPPMPPGLAEIVHRCLDKSLDRRWASAESIVRALRDVDVHARALASADTDDVALPSDEQRVMALVLAEGVVDSARLERAITSWGGELIPMLGGSAIGVFGKSTWEGDETARAVSAALEARDAVLWIAVASGRATGSGQTISGDAVRAVERACAAHLPGVAIDVNASRSVSNVFELQRTGGEVLEVARGAVRRDSLSSGTSLENEGPILGREAELAQLESAVTSAFEEERATAVWITGPPGIGKSRLRQELEKRLRRRTPRTVVLSGRAESHRREATYHLIGSALRSAPGLEDALSSSGVGLELRRQAIERFCLTWIREPHASLECAEAISELLGVPWQSEGGGRRSDPQLRADRLRIALTDLVLAICERHPLALVLDDVQWSDDASLALLVELCERAGDRPLLVTIHARPELAEREQDRFAGIDVVRIEPRGLRASHVATLAASIAGRELDEPLTKTITDRTGGNPFFVEQIVFELADEGLLDAPPAQLPIPIHVEGAVQSRLDHLPPAEKHLCKIAAVLGRGFGPRALDALGVSDAEPLLVSLARRGLLVTRGASLERRDSTTTRDEAPSGVRRALAESAVRSEREYTWKNALVADVAYRMNADRARVELHRRAAGFLANDPGIEPEEIARHHELGGAMADAAMAYASAVRSAQRRGDSQSVLRLSEKAIALGVADRTRFELHVARADALSFLGRRDDQSRELELALAQAATPAEKARALIEKTALHATLGQGDEGTYVGEEAVRAAREVGDVDLIATALARLGWVQLYAGRIHEAGASIGEASRIEGVSPETSALIASWKAQLATARGDLGQRKSAYEEAIARYRDLGDLRRAASAECNLADTLNRVGSYDHAETALREALEVCRRVGNRVVEGFALANLGYALGKLERVDEALEALKEAERIGTQAKQSRLVLAVRLYRARTMLGHREPDLVVREAESVADQARRAGALPWCVLALSVASDARLAAGDVADALALSRRAMGLRDEIGAMEEDESEVFLAHARALVANGYPDEAHEVLTLGLTRLEFLAGRIEDADWRARFLADVPANRALIEMVNANEGRGSMEISDARMAMASWLGALARSGVLANRWEEAGQAVAAYVVGEPQIDELRAWFGAQPPDVAARERRASIEVCIWMAHADREMDPEEVHLLREIIGASLLDEDTQDELVRESHEPPSLVGLEKRLTHPVLRELLLALCWELACSDGRVAKAERAFYEGLAKRLGVSEVRASEIQRAMGERVG